MLTGCWEALKGLGAVIECRVQPSWLIGHRALGSVPGSVQGPWACDRVCVCSPLARTHQP